MSYQRSESLSLACACGCLAAAILTGSCGNDSTTGPSTTTGGDSRLKLEAIVTGRSGSCPSIRFNLGGIRVDTNVSTQFSLSCDRVVDGASVEADATRMTGDALVARQVQTGDESISDPGFEADGLIDALSAAVIDCTAVGGRSVTVQGLSFRVGGFTDFRDVTNGCTGLATGLTVRARGPLTNPPAAPVLPLRATRVEKQ